MSEALLQLEIDALKSRLADAERRNRAALAARTITFRYMNHEGKIEDRVLYLQSLDLLGNPGLGHQPGWFLTGLARDRERNPVRSFPLSHIIPSRNTPTAILALLHRIAL